MGFRVLFFRVFPTSTRHLHHLPPSSHSAFPSLSSSHLSHTQQQPPPSSSAAAAFLSRARDSGDDDLQQLQHSVDSLSLQDADGHVNGQPVGKAPMYSGLSGSMADAAASPNDVSSSYLYNLNLQQSLLSSLNLSALSPGQLALLQQQMQRLSSPSQGVEEQQKQALLQLQLQQQQQQALQMQQLHGAGAGYGRMGYASPSVPRGFRGGGAVVPDERARGGQGGERYHHGRRGRDERNNGLYQQRSHGKYSTYGNGGNGKGYQAGGYRAHDSRGVGYGGMYNQHEMNGEGKLLSPHRPLSPLQQSQSQYQHSPSDPSDESFTSSVVNQFTSTSTLEELTGHIYIVAKDQYGCRLLQRMLDDAQPTGLCDIVFGEVYDHINELMTDAVSRYTHMHRTHSHTPLPLPDCARLLAVGCPLVIVW